jgi:hypothetical protein
MVYEVHITTVNKNFSYQVKAKNVLEAESEALEELKKDISKDHITAGQYSIEHIVNIKEA